MLGGVHTEGQASMGRRCDIEAQVSNTSPNPESVTPRGPSQPISDSVASSHNCADRVATVATESTIFRQALLAATNSDATWGIMPSDTASTTTSKSLPATSSSTLFPFAVVACDSSP